MASQGETRVGRVPPLYAIADWASFGGCKDRAAALIAAVELWAELGIGWIQLRIKQMDDLDRYRLVERCVETLGDRSREVLWINDRVDLAAMFPVHGVHLGQNDLPPAAARGILGDGVVIGWSTHNLDQVRAAASNDAVDVVAIGPVFATSSKAQPDPVVGVDLVTAARALCDKPLVAIGGIGAQNAASVLSSGADSVAMIGALLRSDQGGSPSLELLRENGERMVELCDRRQSS